MITMNEANNLSDNRLVFSKELCVKSYDSDMFKQMSLPAIMRYLQEIAGDHLSCLDLPYEKLFSDGVVFLLSGLEIHVYTPPVLWQDITLSTWSYGIKGATFTRNSRICDKKGSTLVEASAGWFLANPQTHRIVRPKDYPPVLAIPENPDPVFSNGRFHINRPADAKKLCDRKVLFSDADYNRHLNNTKYAEIITDIYSRRLEQDRISHFKIIYAGEAKVFDTIEIFESGNILLGTRDGQRCFECETEFVKR